MFVICSFPKSIYDWVFRKQDLLSEMLSLEDERLDLEDALATFPIIGKRRIKEPFCKWYYESLLENREGEYQAKREPPWLDFAIERVGKEEPSGFGKLETNKIQH